MTNNCLRIRLCIRFHYFKYINFQAKLVLTFPLLKLLLHTHMCVATYCGYRFCLISFCFDPIRLVSFSFALHFNQCQWTWSLFSALQYLPWHKVQYPYPPENSLRKPENSLRKHTYQFRSVPFRFVSFHSPFPMANPTHIGWNKRCPIVTPNKMIHRGIWKVQSTRKSIFNSKEHTLMAFRNFRMTPVL